MPRSSAAFPQLQQMNHNPLRSLLFDPTSTLLSAAQDLTLPSLPSLVEQVIKELLGHIDTVTGLDFLGFAEALGALFTGGEDLLLSMLDSIPLLGSIIQVLTGTNPISALQGATQEFAQFILDIVQLLGNPSGLGTGNPVINALFTAIPILGPLVNAIEADFINPVLGIAEHVLPFVMPFVIGAQTTFQDFGAFLGNLADKHALQELQDVVTNSVSGITQTEQFIVSTTKAQLAAAIANFQNVASAAQAMAQQALAQVNAILNQVAQFVTVIIPNSNISALLGASVAGAQSLAGQFQALIDASNNALIGAENSVGSTISQFQNAFGSLVSLIGWTPTGVAPVQSVTGMVQAHQQFINNMAPPNYAALLQGAYVTFPLSQVVGNGSAPTVNCTDSQSLIGYITTTNGGILKSIGWLGGATTNVTYIAINIYLVNQNNGSLQLLIASGNLIPVIPIANNGTPQWTYWNFGALTGQALVAGQGNVYAVEIQTGGTGSFPVVGVSPSWLPVHPTAIPPFYSATRAGAVPQFDTFNNGAHQTSSTSWSLTWQHNFGASPSTLGVVWVNPHGVSGSFSGVTCTIGGVSASLISSASTSQGNLFAYAANNIPSGVQTIVFSGTLGSAMAGNGFSTSYLGVHSVAAGATLATAGTTGEGALTISPTAGQLAVVGLNPEGSATPSSGFNAITNVEFNPTVNETLAILDAAGPATVNFVAATAQATFWEGVSLLLTGTVQNPPDWQLAPTSLASTPVPYLEIAAVPGATQYAPETFTFSGNTSTGLTVYSWTPPLWANYIDLVVIPDGGQGGGTANSINPQNSGLGGQAGTWFGITLLTTNIAGGTVSPGPWTIQVGGGGGLGGVAAGNGANGYGVIITAPGYSNTLAGGAGGAYGAGNFGSFGANSNGQSPGNFTFNGQNYVGGGAQNLPQQAGYGPGGGGAGGIQIGGDTNYHGGPGAIATVYLIAYTTKGQN